MKKYYVNWSVEGILSNWGVLLGRCFWGHVLLSQHVYIMPMPNAVWLKLFVPATLLAITSAPQHGDLELRSKRRCGPLWCVGVAGGWSGLGIGNGAHLFCFCTLARFARLVLLAAGLLACSALCCASAWFLLVTTRHPFWFVLVPAGGNRFALGTGGIRRSLLVGGLGPVLSIPKLCFKPFRTPYLNHHFFEHHGGEAPPATHPLPFRLLAE